MYVCAYVCIDCRWIAAAAAECNAFKVYLPTCKFNAKTENITACVTQFSVFFILFSFLFEFRDGRGLGNAYSQV